MDMTIARMSSGERATLINLLHRGLANMPKTQRDPRTVELADRLERVLTETPNLDRHSANALELLAFAPRGLRLTGVEPEVLGELEQLGHIARLYQQRYWVITYPGWQRLWDSGRAQQMIDSMTA